MPVLSDDFIARFTLGKRLEAIVRDSRLKGFALRVRRKADGKLSRTFFVIEELPADDDGKRKRRKITIGDHPTFSADHAREEAQAILQAISKGDNPVAAKAAKKKRPTMKTLEREFDANHIAEKKRTTQWDYRGRIKRRIMPEFGNLLVEDITRQQIRDWHRKRKDHPVDTNRDLAVLSKMLSFAVEMDWIQLNPCMGIPRFKEHARDTWLDEQDLPKFKTALAKFGGPHADAIRFMALTGWRVSEVRSLTWDEVDLGRLTVRLGDTKTGAQVRWLDQDAAAILERQPHRVGYAFSKRRGYALDVKHINATLGDICTAAGIERITCHTLRRTAATWAAISGAGTHELRETFGWATTAMADRYVKKAESLGKRGASRVASAINLYDRQDEPKLKVVK